MRHTEGLDDEDGVVGDKGIRRHGVSCCGRKEERQGSSDEIIDFRSQTQEEAHKEGIGMVAGRWGGPQA